MSVTLTMDTATRYARTPQEVISASAAVDFLLTATSVNVTVSQ